MLIYVFRCLDIDFVLFDYIGCKYMLSFVGVCLLGPGKRH